MKRSGLVFILLGFLGIQEAFAFLVVIDPGHGGADFGTIFQSENQQITEKQATLTLSQKIAQELLFHGIDVALTRSFDQEVSLPKRTAFANRLKADLFISIHMNSSQSLSQEMFKRPEGIEIFVLNHTTDASSRRLAQLENSVLDDFEKSLFYQQTDVALILKDLKLDANFKKSQQLACQIQEKLVQNTSRNNALLDQKRNRGVKEALFHVLLGANMPSVLVETGFLSHPRDRAWILSVQGQKRIAKSISAAVMEYRFSSQQSFHFIGKCKLR